MLIQIINKIWSCTIYVAENPAFLLNMYKDYLRIRDITSEEEWEGRGKVFLIGKAAFASRAWREFPFSKIPVMLHLFSFHLEKLFSIYHSRLDSRD